MKKGRIILVYYRDTLNVVNQILKMKCVKEGTHSVVWVTDLNTAKKVIAESEVDILFIDPFALCQDLGGTSGVLTNKVREQLPALFETHFKRISHRFLLGDTYYKNRWKGLENIQVDNKPIFSFTIEDGALEDFLKRK